MLVEEGEGEAANGEPEAAAAAEVVGVVLSRGEDVPGDRGAALGVPPAFLPGVVRGFEGLAKWEPAAAGPDPDGAGRGEEEEEEDDARVMRWPNMLRSSVTDLWDGSSSSGLGAGRSEPGDAAIFLLRLLPVAVALVLEPPLRLAQLKSLPVTATGLPAADSLQAQVPGRARSRVWLLCGCLATLRFLSRACTPRARVV